MKTLHFRSVARSALALFLVVPSHLPAVAAHERFLPSAVMREQAFAARAAQGWTAPPAHMALMRAEARVRHTEAPSVREIHETAIDRFSRFGRDMVDRLEARLTIPRWTAFIGEGRPSQRILIPNPTALVLYKPVFQPGQTVWGPFGRGKVVVAGAGAVVVLYDRPMFVSIEQGDFRQAPFTDAQMHTISTKRTSTQAIRVVYLGEGLKELSLLSPEENALRRARERLYLDIGTHPDNSDEGVRHAYRATVLRNRGNPRKLANLAAAWHKIELERGLIDETDGAPSEWLSLAQAAEASEIPNLDLAEFLPTITSIGGIEILRDNMRHFIIPRRAIPALRAWYNGLYKDLLAWLNDSSLAWEERIQCSLPLALCDRLAALRAEGPFTDWFNFERRWRAALQRELGHRLATKAMESVRRQLRHAFQVSASRHMRSVPAEVKSAALHALQTATKRMLLKIFYVPSANNHWHYLKPARSESLAKAITKARPVSLRELHTRGLVHETELAVVLYRLFAGVDRPMRARAAVAAAG